MTTLPIDYTKRPWRPKYIDEETPMFARWFVFGTHADGTVDISDVDGDVFVSVPDDVAERIIAARNVFVDAILAEIGAK